MTAEAEKRRTEALSIADLDMLAAEFARLHAVAGGPAPASRQGDAEADDDGAALPAMAGPPEAYERFFQQVHALGGDGRTALCLSGGGIRSAAFNLGVLQALAAVGLLDKFHYLSTVSGGGYIGCWLTLWRKRASLREVLNGLGWPLLDDAQGDQMPIVGPEAIRSLRGKTSYLAPRMGLLSSDTWTAVVLYLRNLLLNLLILLPVLAALALLPKFILLVIDMVLDHGPIILFETDALLALMIATWILGWTILALARPAWAPDVPLHDRVASAAAQCKSRRSAKFGSTVILAASLLYGLFAIGWVGLDLPGESGFILRVGSGLGAFAGFTAFLVALLCGLRAHLRRGRKTWRRALVARTPLVWLGATISGAVVGTFLGAGLLLVRYLWCYADNWLIWTFCLAPPWFVVGHLTGDSIYLGLTARRKKAPRGPGDPGKPRDPWGDLEREWLARSGGLMLTWIGMTAAFVLFDVFADPIWHFAESTSTGRWHGYYTLVTGIASFGGSVLLGFSSLTGGNRGQEKPTRLPLQAILIVATPLFALILVSGVSYLTDVALHPSGFFDIVRTSAACAAPGECEPVWRSASSAASATGLRVALGDLLAIDWTSEKPLAAGIELLAMIGLAALGLIASMLVNINRFSLHDVYRLRLMREFLGASNLHREAEVDGWTGFTDADDDDLATLWPREGSPQLAAWERCLYPVINTTLNLVETNRLAWQERKGEPFVFTPDHVGSARLGYRPPAEAAGGVRISSAMTISGAAVSPNAGYSTVPGLALLMTMFNLRLGAWVGNPHNRHSYRRRGPRWALRPLLVEAFSATTERDTTKYVFLSDGGHFDNLGLYEMLRRRCRYIVVSDAGYDPDYAFADLGRVVRQASIDMGIRVRFQHLSMARRPKPGEPAPATDQAYFAVATIEYPERVAVDGRVAPALGYLLYVKPGFQNRSEPADVRAFAAANPAFPHDSTVNQFFGESQFESYRSLGRHIVRDLVVGPDQTGRLPSSLSSAFQRGRLRLRAAAEPRTASGAGPLAGKRWRFSRPS
ncbi:MAG TPA: patatin-like phospholipase family protein [Aliidongia sp.]|nr:patatin-like phospholipase family protein [Aliidongia sp.]